MASALTRFSSAACAFLTRFVPATRGGSRRHCVNWKACVLYDFTFTTKVTACCKLVGKYKGICVIMATPLVMQRQKPRGVNGFCLGDMNHNNSVHMQEVIDKADKLLSEYQYEELFNFLSQYTHVDNDELLWRLAQAYCAWAKIEGERGHSGRRRELMEKGFTFAQRALSLNDKCGKCHSWYATMVHYTSEYHGVKTHYLNAFIIRDHYEKAIAIDPLDAVSLHSLGHWCFAFAHLPWYQRKLLSVLFRDPPKTTFEQALEYFYRAEKASPGFFIMNLVMIGRTHWQLGDHEKAKDMLKRAIQISPKSTDDREAHELAHEMLKKIEAKNGHR